MKKMVTLKQVLLAEGGNAIEGARPVTQKEAKKVARDVTAWLEKNVPGIKIRQIGSAGLKDVDEYSGDVDLAVQLPLGISQEGLIEQMTGDLALHIRHLKGINTITLGYNIGEDLVQVDLMVVDDIRHAEWALTASKDDLSAGLKAAHRNELIYAVAKFADQKLMGDSKRERYYYDLTRGLMRGTQELNKDKQWRLVGDRDVITTDPVELVKTLFGDTFTPETLSSYDRVLNAVLSPRFRWKAHVPAIIKTTEVNMQRKGLKVPASLKRYIGG